MVGANYGRGMRYRVLGPVRVEKDGEEIPLGGPQQRLVLALLIAAHGRMVSSSGLIDAIWPDEPPPTAKKTIQGYISHLRAQLGDALATQGSSYSLDTHGAVDSLEFEDLRQRGQELLDVDPIAAASVFREALALWDGPAFAELSDQLALAPDITRLEDLRIAVLGDRIDADLGCGGHRGMIGELDGLTQEFPLHDRFRGQHMVALYRAGRQVEALRSFERTRRFLAEEMGLDPSPELREIEQKILDGDSSLDLDGEGQQSGRAAVRGYELREVVATTESVETYRAYQRSVGREVTVQVLGPGVADDPQFIANFVTDTKRVAALEHPHIGFVYDTWREPGRAYQVSRWFPGGSLADRMAMEKFSAPKALRVLDQVGGALAYAHRQSVPHGQVSASTVLFDDDGNAFLRDFLVGRNGHATADNDRRDFASLTHLLLTGTNPQQIDGRLARALSISDVPETVKSVFEVAFEPAGGYARVEDFLRALHQAMGTEAVVPDRAEAQSMTAVRNPYKGLRAFQEADADDFFGRDDLVERLVARLDSNRLVAVIGPSGSGKSSAVKAGLSARIRSREGGPVRLQTEMFPGAFPFEELEGALLRVGVNRESVISELLSDERGLLRVLKQIMPADDAELLLIIDQFEELFSMATDRKVIQLFLNSLLTAVSDPRSRLRVVVTMRADFYDRPLQHPEFGTLLETGLVSVTMPDQVGLSAAVAQPALAVGLEFEPGLVDRVVRDLDDQPGGLPLLQYAMTELVAQRTSDVLTFAGYESIGGVYGALGKRAEDLYEALPPAGQRAIHQAFLRMVTVDEGAKDLRRRVTRAELAATDVDDAALSEALQLYGGHRLLTFDRDPITRASTVEVAHEALTREWERLDGWITDERDDLVVRRRVDEALAEWEDSGEDPSFLPSGSRLAQFEDWSTSTNLALSSHERDFLDAGAARDGDLKHRAASRRRRLVAGLAAVAVIMTVVAAFAFAQKRSSDRVAFDSETARLGANAGVLTGQDPQLGLLMAAEAFRREDSPHTLGAMQTAMVSAAPFTSFVDIEASQLEWSADRLFLLTSTGVDVLDVQTREVMQSFALEAADDSANDFLDAKFDGTSVPFASSPDGRWVGVALENGDFAAIDVDANRRFDLRLEGRVTAAAFDAQSETLALGGASGSTRIVSLADMGTVVEIAPIDDAGSFRDLGVDTQGLWRHIAPDYEAVIFRVSSLAFNGDASRLAIAQGPRVVVVDSARGTRVMEPVATSTLGFFGTEQDNQLPFASQTLRFDGENLLAKGFHTFVRIDTVEGVVRNKSSLVDRANLDLFGFAPTVVRHLESEQVLVLMPDGRLQLLDTSDAASGARRETLSIRVVWEVQMTREVEEALALSPDGSSWAVAQEGGIVFGRLDGSQLLAEGTRRSSEDQVQRGFVAQPKAQRPLLSIGSTGTIIAASASSSLMTRNEAGAYRTSDSAFTGRARFGESKDDAPDVLVAVARNTAALFSGDELSSAGRVQGIREVFGVSPDGTMLAYWSCTQSAGRDGDNSQSDSLRAASPRLAALDCPPAGMKIIDIASGELLASLSTGGEIVVIEWHPSGDAVFAVDVQGGIQEWLVGTWDSTETQVSQNSRPTISFRFSPDGRLAARTDRAGVVDIVEVSSGDVDVTFAGDAGLVRSSSHAESPWFSVGNEHLLTSRDGTVRLWDVESGAQIGVPFPNDVEVSAGGRSGDVLQLVTAVEDNLLIWNLDTSTWFDVACDAAGRNMTRAEWEQFGPRDSEYRATCPQYEIED